MNRFATRSDLRELIDAPDIPFSDWKICLAELNVINTWLGGHRITIEGIKKLLPVNASSLHVAEIGCGGGDNLVAIERWNRKRKRPLDIHYTAIDLNKACIDLARENCRSLPVHFIHADYRVASLPERPDVIFSSLFCHHLNRPQLRELLEWLGRNARVGFFMNDLHRNPVAYHSIRILTRLFSRSYLVKNDAPVSVLRSFKRNDWTELLQEAECAFYEINWKWAFRYLVSVRYHTTT